MYILDIKKNNVTYLVIAIICGIFSCIYEYFSHEVYSLFMILPGGVVLVLGILFNMMLRKKHNKWSYRFYNSSVAFLIVGMYIKGVLDIYGTTNELLGVYFLVSAMFLILSIVSIYRFTNN